MLMMNRFVLAVALITVGCGIGYLGVRAVTAPDLSLSFGYRNDMGDEEESERVGERFVLLLIQVMGVVFTGVGLITVLFGVLALLTVVEWLL